MKVLSGYFHFYFVLEQNQSKLQGETGGKMKFMHRPLSLPLEKSQMPSDYG